MLSKLRLTFLVLLLCGSLAVMLLAVDGPAYRTSAVLHETGTDEPDTTHVGARGGDESIPGRDATPGTHAEQRFEVQRTARSPISASEGTRARIVGRLVDPDGDAVTGAKLSLAGRPTLPNYVRVQNTSEPMVQSTLRMDGGFELGYPPDEPPFVGEDRAELVVTRAGHEAVAMVVPLGRQVLELGDVVLPRLTLVTGVLLDEETEPVAGARVLALRTCDVANRAWPSDHDRGSFDDALATTETDPSGRFTLHGLELPEALLFETAFGAVLQPHRPETEAIYRLPASVHRSLRVRTPAGIPVRATATALARSRFGWVTIASPAPCDAEGVVALTVPVGSETAVGIMAPGFRPRIVEFSSEETPGREIRLEHAFERELSIVDARTGRPIDGAKAELLVPASIWVDGFEVSGAPLGLEGDRALRSIDLSKPGSGAAILQPERAPTVVRVDRLGDWILAVHAEGFARELVRGAFDTADQMGEPLQVRLAPERQIVGTVRDRTTGEHLSGATVRLLHPAEIEEPLVGGAAAALPQTTTDERGSFRLGNAPDEVFHVVAVRAGFAPAVSEPIDLRNAGAIHVRLELERNAELAGRVTTSDPTLGPCYSIELLQEGVEDPGSTLERSITRTLSGRFRSVVSAPDGSFTVPELAPGRWRVEVRTQDDQRPWSRPTEARGGTLGGLLAALTTLQDPTKPLGSTTLEVRPGESVSVDVSVGRQADESARVEAYLTNTMPELEMELTATYSTGTFERRVHVSEFGLFDFGFVPPGAASIHVRGRIDEFAQDRHFLGVAHVDLRPGTHETVPIDVRGAALVWLEPQDAATGAFVSVRSLHYGSRSIRGFSGSKLKQDGKPLVLPAGEYVACAKAEGYAVRYFEFEVTEHEPTLVLPLPMWAAREESTRFFDGTGQPLPDHRFLIDRIGDMDIPAGIRASFVTDANGAGQLGRISPGVYSIAAFEPRGDLVYRGEIDLTEPRSEIVLR